MELDEHVAFFNALIRRFAEPAEVDAYDALSKTAQRAIDQNDNGFDNILDNMKTKVTLILFRQDWFIVDRYKNLISTPGSYLDRHQFQQLKAAGDQALAKDDIQQLRRIVLELMSIRIGGDSGDSMYDIANIIKG